MALNPDLVLHRGYAMVYRKGEIVGSARRLKSGDGIDIRFDDGVVPSKVT
jgi:exonuclease VII large subunit